MIKSVSKLVTIGIVLLGMTGCAGTSPNTEAKKTLQTAKGYTIGHVNVTLAKDVIYDFSEEQKHYPNEEKLSTFFKQDIEKYLKQYGKSCQNTQACLTLDVDINYKRNFNINSVSVSAPIIDRTITIHKGNTIVYSNTQKRLRPSKGGIFGKALNEVAMFTKAGEDKPNLQDEREHIDIISKVTVENIVQLAQ